MSINYSICPYRYVTIREVLRVASQIVDEPLLKSVKLCGSTIVSHSILSTRDVNTHATFQVPSLEVQVPAELTGWIGGKHAEAADWAWVLCEIAIISGFNVNITHLAFVLTKSVQQDSYETRSFLKFAKENVQVPELSLVM